MPRILSPGRNCWRTPRAERVAFLVDGAAYFAALAQSLHAAERSIMVVGWDVDSRVELVRDGREHGRPTTLGPLLEHLARRNRDLRIHVLAWDFAMVFALERQPQPLFHLDLATNRRVRVHMDSEHPLGASHHQKIVVVDDKVAFVGGLDLTTRRWDTPEHRPDDPRRVGPTGQAYGPFHDVQMAVDGAAAASLGKLVRERWRRATGRRLAPPPPTPGDPWPTGLAPDLAGVEVAVVRTEPSYKGRREVREVEALYLDAVAAARRTIYIENQYLTSPAVADALARRLAEPEGPEVVLVLPRNSGGWLEESVLGVLRGRVLRHLVAADAHGRLGMFYPQAGPQAPVRVHAKLMVVDDVLARVGSANLNNRSMGLDTECDLAVEAEPGSEAARAVAALPRRLLAEHLGCAAGAVEAAQAAAGGSLLGAVRALGKPGRGLVPLAASPSHLPPEVVEGIAGLDPAEPVALDRILDMFVQDGDQEQSGMGPVLVILGLLAGLLLLAAAWRFTPLAALAEPHALSSWAQELGNSPQAPFWAAAALGALTLAMVPVTVLVATAAVVFPPKPAALCALAGGLAGAMAAYGLGRALGRGRVRRLAGRRLNAVSRRMARTGLWAVLAVRLLPVAPFTVINLVAGAARIRLRHFVLGTVLGMAPGVLAVTLLADRLHAAVLDPDWTNLALAGVLGLALAGVAVALRRRLLRWGGRRGRTGGGRG